MLAAIPGSVKAQGILAAAFVAVSYHHVSTGGITGSRLGSYLTVEP